MGKEDSLMGEYKRIRVEKSDEPDFFEFSREIEEVWSTFKRSNPKATDERKIRLNSYYKEEGNMVVRLSGGISFANVIYSDFLRRERDLPHTPEETYEFRDGVFYARIPFSNAASVAGIILFDPNESYDPQDSELKTVLSVRSKRQATNPGSLGILVNGYIDVGNVSGALLEDNLFRETEEESHIKMEEIKNICFVGPSQTRGKTCDLVWMLRTSMSYNYWMERWKKEKGQFESGGVIPVGLSEIQRIVEWEFVRERILKEGVISDELRRNVTTEEIHLHPMLQSLYPVLLAERASYYLEMMKDENSIYGQ